MNTIIRSNGEKLFHQQFTKMSNEGLIIYPDAGIDRDAVNEFYLEDLFPSMEEGKTYILYEVYLGTIFEILDNYVKINQTPVIRQYFEDNYVHRDITDVKHKIDEKFLSVDYLCVRKENGKISFDRTMELQGSQHNPHNPSTKTIQLARDAIKAAVLKKLGIECVYTNSEFARCGVRSYERRVVKMECENFI